jgi:hypothetical protein
VTVLSDVAIAATVVVDVGLGDRVGARARQRAALRDRQAGVDEGCAGDAVAVLVAEQRVIDRDAGQRGVAGVEGDDRVVDEVAGRVTLDSAASLVTFSEGFGVSEFENVQVTFSPSLRLMVTPFVGELVFCEPPFALVTWQARWSSCQPPGATPRRVGLEARDHREDLGVGRGPVVDELKLARAPGSR